jgi:DNA-binding NarL/FixJ family response regulator
MLVKLSARQREVAALVAAGLTDAEIADRLVISRRTVRSHVADVLRLIEAANRVEIACAVVMAQILNLIV